MNSHSQFRSEVVDTLFADESMISRYVEIETSLALVQGQLGIIPMEAAKSIAETDVLSSFDLDRYKHDFDLVGYPIVGLVRQLTEQVPNGYGEYVHWGATTQDIMDTGLVLTLRKVVDILQKELNLLVEKLTSLANTYKSTLMIGRSQLQQAIPITFGYKVTGWIAPLIRHRERLEHIKPRLLQIQFGGAVGTLASLGEKGFKVKKALAKMLDLNESILTWHTQRDNLMELMTFMSLLTGSLSKIATDVMFMTQTEVGELSEKPKPGGGRSSTMPQKRNPILTQNILVSGKLARTKLSGLLESMIQDHERGSATWQVEWSLIPDLCSHSMSALQSTNKLFESLEIHIDRMHTNLEITDSMIYAESIMMELASVLGRQRAHDVVDEAVSLSLSGMSFDEALQKIPEIHDVLSQDVLKDIFSGKVHREMAEKIATKMLTVIKNN